MIKNDSNELFKKFFLEMDPRKGYPVRGRIIMKKWDSRPPRLSCGQDSVCAHFSHTAHSRARPLQSLICLPRIVWPSACSLQSHLLLMCLPRTIHSITHSITSAPAENSCCGTVKYLPSEKCSVCLLFLSFLFHSPKSRFFFSLHIPIPSYSSIPL